MGDKLNNYTRDHDQKEIEEIPKELQKQIDKVKNIGLAEELSNFMLHKEIKSTSLYGTSDSTNFGTNKIADFDHNTSFRSNGVSGLYGTTMVNKIIEPKIKRLRGRPKGTLRPSNKEKKLNIPLSRKHGAYSFISTGDLPKEKMHLLKFVNRERLKWIEQIGGKDNLSYMEMSLIDEATRLLLYCVMINDFLLRKNNEDIVYKDTETGELKMHSALSRNYLSYTKTYVNILKELNKINKLGPKKSIGRDIASMAQNLYSNKK